MFRRLTQAAIVPLLFALTTQAATAATINVAGLSHQADDESLCAAFRPHGHVDSCRVIMDPDTGRNTGKAVVQMDNPIEASNAVTALNESTLQGRTLIVRLDPDSVRATPGFQDDPAASDRGRGSGRSARSPRPPATPAPTAPVPAPTPE